MILGLVLMAQGGVSPPVSTIPLDDIFSAFDAICVANTELADQKAAAERLPAVVKTVGPRTDPKTKQDLLPSTRYFSGGLQIGMLGYSNGASCYAIARIDAAIEPEAFRDAVGTRFAGKPREMMKRKGFYHGGWNTNKMTIELEWKREDGANIGLLSIRRRDGFAK